MDKIYNDETKRLFGRMMDLFRQVVSAYVKSAASDAAAEARVFVDFIIAKPFVKRHSDSYRNHGINLVVSSANKHITAQHITAQHIITYHVKQCKQCKHAHNI
ncbi:hypothetical protein GGI18_000991 [Coemansia linderi]|uniref:Uncharacterized protein n=1 Tax=Coemansia linderi TaxID=2663919 RepID=A0ACC1KLV0_9FUNG|nr:hypothetical protein GGI18_000991 [Coemansia linderi]